MGGDLQHAGWLAGLKIAAVAVVAQAVWGMGTQLCPDRSRLTMALFAAVAMLLCPTGPTPLLVIIAGGMLGWARYRRIRVPTNPAPLPFTLSHARGAAALLLFFFLIWSCCRSRPPRRIYAGLDYFSGFYRAGALVFGGGHVVLPLLQSQVVHRGWVDDGTFVAGYGLAQALPGPLFSFAAYLGAAAKQPPNGWLGRYLPAGHLSLAAAADGRSDPLLGNPAAHPFGAGGAQGGECGCNGFLLAALFDPLWMTAIHSGRDLALALVAFALLLYGGFRRGSSCCSRQRAGQLWLGADEILGYVDRVFKGLLAPACNRP